MNFSVGTLKLIGMVCYEIEECKLGPEHLGVKCISQHEHFLIL